MGVLSCSWHGRHLQRRLLQFRSSAKFVVFVVVFAIFTIIPVIPTALPERGVIEGNDVQRWVSILGAVFSAATLVVSPLTWYWIGRVDSLRWPFMAGLIVLTGATALLCVGTHLGLWIAGRLLQGAANGVVWTVGSALLRETMGEEGLGQAFGYVGMGMNLGGSPGRCWATRPATNGLESRGESPEGALPAPPALDDEVNSRSVQADRACASQTLATDSKVVSALLSCPRLWVVLWGYMVTAMIMTAFDSVLALFVRERFGWNQSAQGLVFLALFIPQLLNPAVGMICDRYPRAGRYMVSGAFGIGCLTLSLLRLVVGDSVGSKVLLCTLLAVVGLCVTFSMTPLFVEISDMVGDMEKKAPGKLNQAAASALGYGLMNSAWSAGALVGPFLAGFIKDAAGWNTMAWVLGLVVGVSAVLVLLFMEKSWLLPNCRSTALCQNEVIDGVPL
ncbi:putative MFS transporter [Aspergillus novofumigatus IBT 16806]|uniref:Putative MFS transporter n=1 Tax=Aspergillus novofumigatus (strain IBT 16806) TaxID=1392255 RepID=A0A2I1BXC2_ASPN1|nr:putative MFS transporter [Aspergillus novofumigatus IBT 16806]PKX90033.1 putative MFS transporter [Aspergillus novofumigatus IBT 16806]